MWAAYNISTDFPKNVATSVTHILAYSKKISPMWLCPTMYENRYKVVTRMITGGHVTTRRKPQLSEEDPWLGRKLNFTRCSLVSMWISIYKVIPIYKYKEHDLLKNYRPISLLPAISKILEKVIQKRLYSFLVKNNVLHKHQYRFRKKRSTII